MLATETSTQLLAKLAAIAQAADEAGSLVKTLATAGASVEVARWLPSLAEAIERIQLDCAEARFSTRELREALPAPDALQTRLL